MPSLQTTVAYQTKSATVTNAVKPISHADFGFTAGELAAADRAYVSARTAGIMISWSTVDPSATVGHLIAQNAILEVQGNVNVQNLEFFREAGADATVTITLEKYPGV